MFVKVFDENREAEWINTDHIAVIQKQNLYEGDMDLYTIHLDCAIDSMDRNTVLFRQIGEELRQMLS